MKTGARYYRTGKRRTFDLPGADHEKLLYGPAFVDLQCNGFAGVDFNRPDTTPEQIGAAIHAMRPLGLADGRTVENRGARLRRRARHLLTGDSGSINNATTSRICCSDRILL